MSSLSDLIEQYLKEMLSRSESIEVQRWRLAQMFRCVPSQINYVLETRFTKRHGYLVYSRRGGGGFIKIARIDWGPETNLPQILKKTIGARITRLEMEALLHRLIRNSIIGEKEAFLLNEVVEQEMEGLDEEEAALLRAPLLRAILLFVCGRDDG